jgi:hypothetical protein
VSRAEKREVGFQGDGRTSFDWQPVVRPPIAKGCGLGKSPKRVLRIFPVIMLGRKKLDSSERPPLSVASVQHVLLHSDPSPSQRTAVRTQPARKLRENPNRPHACGACPLRIIRLLPLEILTTLGLAESFSGLWAQLVVPVIDRRVERYAIEHCGSLRTLLKLPSWKNLPSNVVRHVASFIQYTAWLPWRIPSGTLVYINDPLS